MKVLIAYDGSEHTDAALEELHRAGFHDVTAKVLTVAELWILKSDILATPVAEHVREGMHEHYERAVSRSRETADRGAARLRERFPYWHIESESAAGNAVEIIVSNAESWHADLVVVGPHVHPTLLHPLPGSVSLGVLTHAPCSVRVTRPPLKPREDKPIRLLLAIDGSKSGQLALEQVQSRAWPAGTHVYIVMVVDTRLIPVVIPGVSIGPTCEAWAQEIAGKAAEQLHNCGIAASVSVEQGDPRDVLCKCAAAWEADCIFVGSLGLSRLPWMRLGSIATGISVRAQCSVEVVRPRTR